MGQAPPAASPASLSRPLSPLRLVISADGQVIKAPYTRLSNDISTHESSREYEYDANVVDQLKVNR